MIESCGEGSNYKQTNEQTNKRSGWIGKHEGEGGEQGWGGEGARMRKERKDPLFGIFD